MRLDKLDTSKFLYDPKDPDSFLKLRKYKEFKKAVKGIPIDRVIPYIILVYDPASQELAQEYVELPQRKMKVASMVEMTPLKRVTPELEDMLIGKNKVVNAMIIKYLHLFNDPNILMLSAFKEIYSSLSKAALEGEYGKPLIQSIQTVNESIKSLTDNILRGKEETELRADLYRSIEGRALGVRVEDIAEKLMRGEDPFPEANPYGKYKPEKLAFEDDR